MSKYKCDDCGEIFDGSLQSCPKCGCPKSECKEYSEPHNQPQQKKNSTSFFIGTFCLAVLSGVISFFVFKAVFRTSTNNDTDSNIENIGITNEKNETTNESFDSNDAVNEEISPDTCTADVCETEVVEETTSFQTKSSEVSDWSMIKPVKLLSDKAYEDFKENHPEWEEQTRSGAYEKETPTFEVKYVSTYGHPFEGNFQVVGRYHHFENGLDMDFNAQVVDGVWYVQLGHGSQKSNAILYVVEGGGLEGTWGKKDKRMWLTD